MVTHDAIYATGEIAQLDDVVRWRDKLWIVEGIDVFGFVHLWPHRRTVFATDAPVVDVRSLELTGRWDNDELERK